MQNWRRGMIAGGLRILKALIDDRELFDYSKGDYIADSIYFLL
jgi:hypothetical protein